MKKATIYLVMMVILVALASAKTHYINTDLDSNDISIGNNDELFIDNGVAGGVGIGTTTIPHAGVGAAKLAIEGTASSTEGPHVQFTVSSDNYPVMQIFNWNHDNLGIAFDAYSDGNSWRSSDAGSNFRIYKYGDKLRFDYAGPVGVGNALTFTDAISIDNAGDVGIGTNTPGAQLSVGNSGTSDAMVYGYGNYYSILGIGSSYGLYGSGNIAGAYGCYSSACATRYGFIGGIAYGAYGQYDADTYGYLGSSTTGAYGQYNSDNYGLLGDTVNYYGAFGSGYTYGLRAYGSGTTIYGVYGVANGAAGGVGTHYGLYGYARGGTTNHGARGYVYDTTSTGNNYGVYGYATGATNNYCIYGATKSWINPDPYDPLLSIIYATLEGGENGAYFRGKANITDGEATVILPEHFEGATSPDYKVTVTVTPRSADSKGLAVVESSNAQFRVKELFDGEGSYEFDYVVMGKRRGYEDDEPIQPNMDYVPFQDNQESLIENNISSQEFYDAYPESVKEIFKKNGILDKDGKINKAVFKDKGWKIFEHPSKEEADSIPDKIGNNGKKEKKWKIIDGDNPPMILNKKDAKKFLEKYQENRDKNLREKLNKEKESKQ